jgi:hypothetical protein
MILALLVACVSSTDETGGAQTAGPCGIAAADGLVPQVERTAAGTTLRVRWTSDVPVRARVRYQAEGGPERATAWEDEPGTEYDAIAWALLPGAAATVQVETEDGACGAAVAVEVGPLPGGVPAITASESNPPSFGSPVAVPVIWMDGNWLVVLDELGRAVWAWEVPVDKHQRWYVPRLAFGPGPDEVTYLWPSIQQEVAGQVVTVGLDGEVRRSVDVPGIHTDLLVHPSGAIVALGFDLREFDDGTRTRKILGTRLVELGADGVQRELWSVFDAHTPDLTRTWGKGWYTPDPEAEDWAHINGIGYDAVTDRYLLTSTYNDGIFALDAATGVEVWTIGSTDAEMIYDDAPPAPLSAPHGVAVDADGLVLVHNRAYADVPPCANVTAIEVNPEAAAFAEVNRYTAPECLQVSFFGNVQATAGGDWLVTYSSLGTLELVDPVAGARRGIWTTPGGYAFGFSSVSAPLPTP